MDSFLERQLKEANETIAKMQFAIAAIKPLLGYEVEICSSCDLPFPVEKGYIEHGYCDCDEDGNLRDWFYVCVACKKEGRLPNCFGCKEPIKEWEEC